MVAEASEVFADVSSRGTSTSKWAKALNQSPGRLASRMPVLARSAKGSIRWTLIRFSISPRARWISSWSRRASNVPALRLVTTKRGLRPPTVGPASPTTRRPRPQLVRVPWVRSVTRRRVARGPPRSQARRKRPPVPLEGAGCGSVPGGDTGSFAPRTRP